MTNTGEQPPPETQAPPASSAFEAGFPSPRWCSDVTGDSTFVGCWHSCSLRGCAWLLLQPPVSSPVERLLRSWLGEGSTGWPLPVTGCGEGASLPSPSCLAPHISAWVTCVGQGGQERSSAGEGTKHCPVGMPPHRSAKKNSQTRTFNVSRPHVSAPRN